MTSPFTFDPNNLPTAEGLKEYQRAQAERLKAIVAKGQQVRAELAATVVEVASRDGSVTVTVGAGGVLQDLTFGPKATGLPQTRLRSNILTAYREGCRQAAERSTQAMAQLAGPDTPAYQMLRDAIPSFPEEDDR